MEDSESDFEVLEREQRLGSIGKYGDYFWVLIVKCDIDEPQRYDGSDEEDDDIVLYYMSRN